MASGAGDASPTTPQTARTSVGVPKELKIREYRVSLTPSTALEFIKKGHAVIVQSGAGCGSGFEDEKYQEVGCRVVSSAAQVYAECDMIMKVKEPLAEEYKLIREGQIIFTFFHFAANKELTDAMIKSKSVCIAYETIMKDGALPLLLPMSEVAGRMAVQEGAKYLEKPMGGLGVLLGGVPGVKPGKVVVIGGGVVGTNAAKVAAGLGADVSVLDLNISRLRYLDEVLPPNVSTIFNTEQSLKDELRTADIVVGAVLIPGARAPKVVKKDHLKLMKKGAVVIDVAVDQGGCIETCKPTTHDNPTFEVDGIVHYCVTNMPGAVPFTSTVALCNSTLRYGTAIAGLGWKGALKVYPELKGGLNIVHGKVVHEAVASALELTLHPVEDVLE